LSTNFFSTRVSVLLDKSNLTQKQLAEKIGIRPQTFNGYMTSYRDVPVEVVISVAKHFEVSADYLLGLSNDPRSKNLFPVESRLAYILENKNKDISWLSKNTEIDEETLSEYTRSASLMPLSHADSIAKALECKIDDLYKWEWA